MFPGVTVRIRLGPPWDHRIGDWIGPGHRRVNRLFERIDSRDSPANWNLEIEIISILFPYDGGVLHDATRWAPPLGHLRVHARRDAGCGFGVVPVLLGTGIDSEFSIIGTQPGTAAIGERMRSVRTARRTISQERVAPVVPIVFCDLEQFHEIHEIVVLPDDGN